jgi:hypothetical protein
MTITKMMMTSTPMMVPIIPRFMEGPPLVPFGGYPCVEEVNTPTFGQPRRL